MIPEPINGIELVGPFEHFDVVLNGYRVPNCSAIKLTGDRDGAYSLLLDRRFLIDCRDKAELFNAALAWANGQAVGAGFSCFGENSQRTNPFKVRMIAIGDIPTPNPDSA